MQIERLLADPNSRPFQDLRNRAAYMQVTGGRPSHLRSFLTTCLRLLAKMNSEPTKFSRCSALWTLDEDMRKKLDLGSHPMVRSVRAHKAKGYRIEVRRDPGSRGEAAGVFMRRGDARLTIRIDGSIRLDWD